MEGRVLIVAGSDSGGGAGIQADIKAVTALGGFAMTAVTALTAQNTEGVHGIHGVETGFINQQIRVVLDDIGADCIKTGMLHSVEVIETVRDTLDEAGPGIPLVVSVLVPRATVLTPNAPEAAALTGVDVEDEAGQQRAGEKLLELGAKAVLVKGGHVAGPEVVDLLVTPEETFRFADPRIETRHTHGTGCTLASSIAAGIAQKMALPEAVARARAYVRQAIAAAPGYGRGHGPLDPGVTFEPGRLEV